MAQGKQLNYSAEEVNQNLGKSHDHSNKSVLDKLSGTTELLFDGKSVKGHDAYEAAVAGGFTKTKAEFYQILNYLNDVVTIS